MKEEKVILKIKEIRDLKHEINNDFVVFFKKYKTIQRKLDKMLAHMEFINEVNNNE